MPRQRHPNEKERDRLAAMSVADMPGEEVEVRVSPRLSAMISLRLDPDRLMKLQAEAHLRKMGVTTTARLLLQEVLERTAPSLSDPQGAHFNLFKPLRPHG